MTWLHDAIGWLFDTGRFAPRMTCAGLSPTLAWVLAASNAVTFAAYLALSYNFGVLIRRRHDRSLAPIFWLLGAFVLFCGMTHAGSVLVTWWPAYRFDALLELATASISVVAAVTTAVYTPRVLRIPPVRALYEQSMALRKMLVDQLSAIAEVSKTDPAAAREAMDRLRVGIEGAST